MTARVQVHTATAALVGLYLLVFGPGVLTSLRVATGSPAPSAPHAWPDRVAALEWDVFTVAVVLYVVVRWLPKHAGEVAGRLQLARPPAGRLAAGAAAFVAAALLSTRLSAAAASAAHLPTAPYTRLAGGLGGFLTTGAAAAAAGVTEEVTLVALAAAVVAAWGDAGLRRRTVPTTVTTTLALLIALRLLVHLYYLWGSLFVLLWVPAGYLIYRWTGSVWPLVVGHWGYDWLALAAADFPRYAPAVQATLWAVAGCGVMVSLVALLRRAQPRCGSTSAAASSP